MNTQTQPVKTNSKNILKLLSSQPALKEMIQISSQPASVKEMIQNDLNQRLQNLETGLQQTQMRLQQLETQYQLSTKQFVELFTNDQLQHSLDFDEWLGEAWMLEKLQQKIEIIKDEVIAINPLILQSLREAEIKCDRVLMRFESAIASKKMQK